MTRFRWFAAGAVFMCFTIVGLAQITHPRAHLTLDGLVSIGSLFTPSTHTYSIGKYIQITVEDSSDLDRFLMSKAGSKVQVTIEPKD